jgi:putative FmdB family regulatory protein
VPIFEYRCEPCNAEFEEALTNQDEIKEYAAWYPCPGCGGRATRLGVSLTNFNFKGGVRGESGVHGQSGVHDLDYPALDKAIGRSAAKRWDRIGKEQAVRDRIRQQTGASALSKEPSKEVNTFRPAEKESLKVREMGVARYLVEKKKAGD